MFRFDTVSDIYNEIYREVRKELIRKKEIRPRAILVANKNNAGFNNGVGNYGFSPEQIKQHKYGQCIELDIDISDELKKTVSFLILERVAELSKPDFILTVAEVWTKNIDGEILGECINFLIQSLDGTYHAHAALKRTGRKVSIPYVAPPLEPRELMGGKLKLF